MTGAFGDGIPIPDVIDPPDSMPMTLCIPKNRDHMAAFFGALYQLTVWNSWQQDGTQHGKELAAVWWRYYLSWDRSMNDLECEDGMKDCCTDPAIILRVNPDTGNVEQSTDGGTTWTPQAGNLQSVIVMPVPPVTNGVANTKCDAASNVKGQVDVWIDQVSNDFDTATSLTEFATAVLIAILAAVLTVISAGALTPLEALVLPTLGAALAAAWGAGKVVFDAYWTTANRDQVFCAAVCTIGDDGSFTDAQFTAFWQRCNAHLPASPAKMLFMGFLSSVGRSGLCAMAASGTSADSDCSDCSCDDVCVADNWSIVTYNGQNVGSIVSRGSNWIILQGSAHPDFGTPWNAMIKTMADDMCCVPISITWLTGDHSGENNFGVNCGNPRWPSSPNGGVTVGVSDLNTVYLRKDSGSNFTAKITFQ